VIGAFRIGNTFPNPYRDAVPGAIVPRFPATASAHGVVARESNRTAKTSRSPFPQPIANVARGDDPHKSADSKAARETNATRPGRRIRTSSHQPVRWTSEAVASGYRQIDGNRVRTFYRTSKPLAAARLGYCDAGRASSPRRV